MNDNNKTKLFHLQKKETSFTVANVTIQSL